MVNVLNTKESCAYNVYENHICYPHVTRIEKERRGDTQGPGSGTKQSWHSAKGTGGLSSSVSSGQQPSSVTGIAHG